MSSSKNMYLPPGPLMYGILASLAHRLTVAGVVSKISATSSVVSLSFCLATISVTILCLSQASSHSRFDTSYAIWPFRYIIAYFIKKGKVSVPLRLGGSLLFVCRCDIMYSAGPLRLSLLRGQRFAGADGFQGLYRRGLSEEARRVG